MAKLYPISTAHNHDEVYVKIGEGGVSDHGALTGLGDNDHPQYLLTTGKAADSDKLDGLDSTDFGRPVFLTAPITSTAWDGDAHSTTSSTKIDMSAVFSGYPTAVVKAALIRLAARDSATLGTTGLEFSVGPISGYPRVHRVIPIGGDVIASALAVVPCNSEGDLYFYIAASNTGTLDAWIEVWGYWL